MRGLLAGFSKFESSSSKIEREADSIRNGADELRAELLAAQRRWSGPLVSYPECGQGGP